MYAFCLSRSCATFALQYGGFVPREWLAVKGPIYRKIDKMVKMYMNSY